MSSPLILALAKHFTDLAKETHRELVGAGSYVIDGGVLLAGALEVRSDRTQAKPLSFELARVLALRTVKIAGRRASRSRIDDELGLWREILSTSLNPADDVVDRSIVLLHEDAIQQVKELHRTEVVLIKGAVTFSGKHRVQELVFGGPT